MNNISPDEVRRQVYRNLSIEVPISSEPAPAAAPNGEPQAPTAQPLFTAAQATQFEKLSAAQMSADMNARGLFIGGGM